MPENRRTLTIQLALFLITLVTTTLAGTEWMHGHLFFFSDKAFGWQEFCQGFQFSIPFLGVLTVHEFGHYFVARRHRVRVSLPYYIPLWFGISPSIGTMGAFIKIREQVQSRIKFFDIGIAGPLAGFVVALLVLWYGFTHLPPPEHIFTIHPEYLEHGLSYPHFVYENAAGNIALGDNLVFWFFKSYVADPALLPHRFEIIHYPYLFAGYLALFFTALNLIPIGQLDGGHILYGLIGKKKFDIVAPTLYVLALTYSGIGLYTLIEFSLFTNEEFYSGLLSLALYAIFLFICLRKVFENPLNALMLALGVVLAQLLIAHFFPGITGYPVFLFFLFILGRFLGIYHPETPDERPLGAGRVVLGIVALLVFVLCFSPQPFIEL
ncbi:site-2 protease family protein [Ravibacter arvi]|uniref:Site-2 protease family protein n=1 Tax=Ravibacter arvi TaxID=2051041 RepID=A0ABP8LSS4_9BACT